jgi:hypothetical protein
MAKCGWTLLAIASVLAVSSCGGQPDRSTPGPAGTSRLSLQRQLETAAAARGAIRRSLSEQGPVQVLALSGGGQWGAFGAGFLKGWTLSGQRPDAFRVVTGTSTGSLLATFAFLGSAFDEAVGRAYLDIHGDSDVFSKRFLLTALFSDALATTEPLRRRLEAQITDDVLTRVAAEGAKGRKLFVGAVDLETGAFKPFDLTAIAARGAAGRTAYVDALMASTAIPVAFPPVVIDGRTYVDGGIRRNIFLQLVVDELTTRRRGELSRGLVATEASVYCLINGTSAVGSSPIRRRTFEIGKRSVNILLDESTDGNLLRVYLLAQRAQLHFLMTQIPADACSAVGSNENQFDPALMRCLYEVGERIAQKDGVWTAEPPIEGPGR